MLLISKKIKTLLILTAFYFNGDAQNKNSKDTTSRIIICKSTLFYPRAAQNNNISGTVIISFDIDTNCRIVNIKIEKGLGYGCDEEAIKALKNCNPILSKAQKICSPILNLKQSFTFKNPEDD